MIKNKIKYLILAIISLSSLFSCKNSEETDTVNTDKTYSTGLENIVGDTTLFNSENFSISDENYWIYDKENSEAVSADKNIICHYFYHLSEDEDKSNAEHITVIIENLAGTGRDFDTYKELVNQQLKVNSYTVNNNSETTIKGYDSWILEYVSTAEDIQQYNYLMCLNVENVIYSFTFTANADNYENHSQIMEDFINSVTFK